MAVSIQGIYVALFGRPADPLGLNFFNEATRIGEDLTAVGDLASTAEYQDRFVGMSEVQIVTSIYQCLFGREPEAEGLDFYVLLLEAGKVSVNWIAIHIMSGAQGEDLAVLENKIASANMFTASFFTQAEIAAYMNNGAAQIGREFIEGITSNPDTIPTQSQIDGLIQLLMKPDEAAPPPAGTIDPGWPTEPSLPQPPEITDADGTSISGTTRSFLLVTVFADGEEIGRIRADEAGQWTLTILLEEGRYTLTAKASDPAGNVSEPSADFRLLVDESGVWADFAIMRDGAGDIFLVSSSGEVKDGILVDIGTIADFASGEDIIEFMVAGEPPASVPVSAVFLLEGLKANTIQGKNTLEDAVSFALMNLIKGEGDHVAFGYGGENYLLFSGDGDASFDAGIDHIVILGTDSTFGTFM